MRENARSLIQRTKDWGGKAGKRPESHTADEGLGRKGGKDRPLIEKFGHALGNLWLYKSRPQGYDEELLQLLFDSANISKFTPQEKIKYDNDMTTRRDILNQIDFAREEGATNKILEIARAMLADGVDISLISKYSGLTKDEIAAL